MPNYRWGIIGPGHIAENFCQQFPAGQTLYGVASAHSPEKAQAFAQKFQIPHVYADHAALLADPAIDVVYIATTNNVHFENIRAALLAGKHVLAEKPVTLNTVQLRTLMALADQRHLILMEAQTIYHMPLYDELAAQVRQRQLGRLRSLHASFGLHTLPDNPTGRLLNPQLGGGGLLDMGIYALSFARRLMTAAPQLEKTVMVPTATGVDDISATVIANAHHELGTFSFNLVPNAPEIGYAVYDRGYFIVDHYLRPEQAIFVDGTTEEQSVIRAGHTDQAMGYEVTAMGHAIATGENPTQAWTLDTMTLMTAMRAAWGLKYPEERD